jgi:adenosylmethionine-8-amino-7-oxononanoate aminotransferase
MKDSLQIWHPYTQKALDPAPVRVVRGEGVYLFTDDGRKLIDGISSWWVNLHGHCHPTMVAAMAGFTHDAVEQLSVDLRKVLPRELDHIFLSDNGSTAVEVALKIAVQYWRNQGRPEKRSIVALEHAYHGDTVGTMSVSAPSMFTDAFSELCFPVHRVHSAYCYRCPVGKTRATCDIECLEKLRRLLEQKQGEIAAVIVEPLLQGVGGMIVHPREFLQRLSRLCREHDVLLIADEVLTGFGRCGRMFACELAEVVPDLMCLSKGLTGGFLPMGATACAGFIHETFVSRDRTRTFFHGHSYTGNPLSAAAAVASLRIFECEPVMERIQAIAAIHQDRLAAIREHPAVGDVRSIGTIAAVELRADDAGYASNLRPKLYDFFLRSGVLLRPLGNIIYVLPPYPIRPDELHYIHDRVAEALELCSAQK